jgi:hypothetical protein
LHKTTLAGLARAWRIRINAALASPVLGLFAALALAPGAHAAVATAPVVALKLALPPLKPRLDCAAVVNIDLTRYTDAKVTMTSAVTTAAAAPAQPYCKVTLTIAPANTVALTLPLDGWSQRYVQVGCGGECGNISGSTPSVSSGCAIVTDGSIATAATDMGHQGGGSPNGSWAANNPQAQIDFAYRAQHVVAQVAKALLQKFYGRAPAYSYFDGCSDGGREAMMAAQRYPTDFNGIIGGALVQDGVTQNTYHHGWNALSNQADDGSYILLAARLPLLHQLVLADCDGIDGLVDGLLDDPRQCHFDPSAHVCPGTDTAACLTAAEAGAARRLHDGPVDANGVHYDHKIAHEWGSELAWTLFVPATAAGPSGSINFVTSWYRYLGQPNQVLPDWNVTKASLPLTPAGFWNAQANAVLLTADNPDLSAFRANGGKMILWHGWSDQHVTPQGALEYFHAIRDQMGAGVEDSFVKLYLFPGVYHCGGGEGPDAADLLTNAMNWVEAGAAPGVVIASQSSNGVVTRTRPIYPFPTVARYDNDGSDPNSYTSFHPLTVPDTVDASDDDHWIGSTLYTPGHQSACVANGTQLVCTPATLPPSVTGP